MMKSFSRIATVFSLVSAFIVPQVAFAASPQQTLNSALSKLETQGAYRMNADIKVDLSSRAVGKRVGEATGSMRFLMTQRVLPNVGMTRDGEGRVSVESFDVASEDFPITLDGPLSFQWKKVGQTLYLRLENAPTSLVDGLKQLDLDVAPFVGQWFRIDLNDKSLLDEVSPSLSSAAALPFSSQLEALKVKPLLQVLRVEKKETRPDDQVVSRQRIRLNPRLSWALQAEEMKKITRTTPNRLQEIQAITKRYVEMRKLLSSLHMVAVVNETTGSLERLEFGLKRTEPKKTCEWSERTNRDICKVTSYETITAAIGVSFLPDTGAPIEAPATSQTFEEALNALKPEPPVEQ